MSPDSKPESAGINPQQRFNITKPKFLVKTMTELRDEYREFVRNPATTSYDITEWLTAFKDDIRPLVPGELIIVIGDTASGKSAMLSNAAMHASDDPLKRIEVLQFHLELPGTLVYERTAAMGNRCPCNMIEYYEKSTDREIYEKIDQHRMHHIYVCEKTNLKIDDMKRIILDDCPKAIERNLGIARPPEMVCIDYLGLMDNSGNKSRYEAVSRNAENLKKLAKETNTIIFVATQIHRRESEDDGTQEIYLHDARDSSSIEQSAGLMFGLWWEYLVNGKERKMILKILKNTKGIAGEKIEIEFDGEKMLMTPKGKI